MQNNNEHLCVNEFRCSRGTMIAPDTEGAETNVNVHSASYRLRKRLRTPMLVISFGTCQGFFHGFALLTRPIQQYLHYMFSSLAKRFAISSENLH